jgi:transcriptional regulator with XRE-family HTH domain
MLPLMRSGILVKEARERAGLTQAALAERAATTQSAIARIENGAEPSFARLEALLSACGLGIQVRLTRFDAEEGPDSIARWTPTDPVRTLARNGVPFVLVGRAAAALLGVAVAVDVPVVVPDLAADALARLSGTLEELHARRRAPGDPDGGTLPFDRSPASLRSRRRWELVTATGAIDVDFEPVGTRGYPDLARRAEERDGVPTASAADAARHLDAAADDLTIVTRLRELAS